MCAAIFLKKIPQALHRFVEVNSNPPISFRFKWAIKSPELYTLDQCTTSNLFILVDTEEFFDLANLDRFINNKQYSFLSELQVKHTLIFEDFEDEMYGSPQKQSSEFQERKL